MKKIVNGLMIGFLVFWVITAPEQVSSAMKSVAQELHRGANSVVTIIQDL
jgi:large-conductance mechanosensitive channel